MGSEKFSRLHQRWGLSQAEGPGVVWMEFSACWSFRNTLGAQMKGWRSHYHHSASCSSLCGVQIRDLYSILNLVYPWIPGPGFPDMILICPCALTIMIHPYKFVEWYLFYRNKSFTSLCCTDGIRLMVHMSIQEYNDPPSKKPKTACKMESL